VALALVAVLWSRGSRPVAVSLAEGPRSFRNFRLRPGAAISLGGAGAADYDLGYPVAGTAHPVATLRRSGKQFQLEPAAAGGNTTGAVTLLVNQEPVQRTVPIASGDEIKIRVPSSNPATPPRELRLEFGPAREEL
jgi:hypothetical protein